MSYTIPLILRIQYCVHITMIFNYFFFFQLRNAIDEWDVSADRKFALLKEHVRTGSLKNHYYR